MASLAKGDKVKALREIDGRWTWNARAGQRGEVIKVSGNKATIHFEKDGFVWPETTISDVAMSDLEKIR